MKSIFFVAQVNQCPEKLPPGTPQEVITFAWVMVQLTFFSENTPPKFNSSTLKNGGTGRRILSYLGK